jgi:hypothetical protein
MTVQQVDSDAGTAAECTRSVSVNNAKWAKSEDHFVIGLTALCWGNRVEAKEQFTNFLTCIDDPTWFSLAN